MTNAFYEIEIDPETALPIRIKVTALTGRKGKTRRKGNKIVGGEHAAFLHAVSGERGGHRSEEAQ